MEKTRAMLMLEGQTGQDVRDLISEAVERTGSVEEAAKEFNLTTGGLYFWIAKLDGDTETQREVTVRATVTFKGYAAKMPVAA